MRGIDHDHRDTLDRVDDALLRQRFADGTVPKDQWTHEAHVRMAWMLLNDLSFDEARKHMRRGVLRLNTLHGLDVIPDRGYHETITVAFLRLVDAAMREDVEKNITHRHSRDFCRQHSHLLEKRVILRHYSQQRIESRAAREAYLDPDQAPLPDTP